VNRDDLEAWLFVALISATGAMLVTLWFGIW
jgi:hypothetical protein